MTATVSSNAALEKKAEVVDQRHFQDRAIEHLACANKQFKRMK